MRIVVISLLQISTCKDFTDACYVGSPLRSDSVIPNCNCGVYLIIFGRLDKVQLGHTTITSWSNWPSISQAPVSCCVVHNSHVSNNYLILYL